jgi:arylsulfatase A-like enzyme
MKLCVLNLRGLGAGHAGPYGNRWIDTPSLDALAAQSILFDWHLSAHPHFSRWVWRTGCHCFAPPASAPGADGWPDLIALLNGAGIATELLIDDSRPSPAGLEGWSEVRRTTGLAATVAAGRDRLTQLSRRANPSLLWIEFASLLRPWDVEERFVTPYFTTPPLPDDEEEDEPDEAVEEDPLQPLFDPPIGPVDPEDDLLFEVIQTTYGAAVTQLDAALADLLDGLSDDVGVLLTSEGGQALGERGVVGPLRPWLHREIVQVPLLLRLPGRCARRRAGGLTLSIDVAPTIADAFGLQMPAAHGRSLLPLLGLDAPAWRGYACLGGWEAGESEWGLWTDGLTLLVPRSGDDRPARLYVKPDDRHEVNDVSQHRIEEVEALSRTLLEYVEVAARPGPLSAPPLYEAEVAANPGSE